MIKNYNKLTDEELKVEAERLEQLDILSGAKECWRVLLTRDNDPIYLCHIGRLSMKLNEWTESEQAFLSAVALLPNLDIPYKWLGILYEKQGEYRKAQHYLNKCLEIKQSATVFTILGTVQNHLGMTRSARKSFNKALEIDSYYEEAYYNLALTIKDEQPKKAITLFLKALDLDPNYACAHRELGWLFRQQNEFANAEVHIKQAVKLNKMDGWANIYLGNLLWAKKKFKLAEKAFLKAIKILPKQSTSHWCLAHFYECQDRFQESKELYEKALLLDPDDIEANLRYGLFLINMKESDKAKSLLKHANNLDPEDERVNKALDKLETS